MRKYLIVASGIAVVAALAGQASAAHLSFYTATISPLSGSGVTGKVNLTLNSNDNTLGVNVMASGLVPNMVHVQHIHGRFDGAGNPIDSTTPTLAQDMDGDGFIELAEGLPTYGPIILNLDSPPGGGLGAFPTAPDGTIDFFEIYDLDNSNSFANGFGMDDLLPLDLREFVLHGGLNPEGVGAGTPGEIDGIAGYKLVLPVGAGEFRLADSNFNVVPLPAAGWMLISALAGLGLLGRSAAHKREA